MSNDATFSLGSRVRSFQHALRGLGTLMATQHNARIHAAATIGVCGVAYLLKIANLEWCFIAVAIVAVWTAEALNTALELLCDATVPDVHPLVGRAKDVAAGGVLISAAGAAVIGILVLGPRALALVP
ncbi:MAG: diacylglycerol kinase family protein [Myxococcales bacterium]|nr:diacylglycerol kinase family protein [Myxococcales bacterium]